MDREERLSEVLLALLGEEGFALFCQAFGGTRVYVPHKLPDDNEIVIAIGRDRAELLHERYEGDTFIAPLGRHVRARYFRKQKLSYAVIARKLGVTESAVIRMLKRGDLQLRPLSGIASTRQLKLF